MATEGVWQTITGLLSGLVIRGNSHSSSGLATSPSFKSFSQLPEKARVKIWKYALPGPRLLRMVGYFGSERVLSSALSHPFHLLHVNNESRQVALTEYCVLRNLSVVPLYINPNIDLLCFLNFDQFQKFIEDRFNQVHKEPPKIDKLVIFGLVETQELDLQDRIEDVIITSYSARFIYPDLQRIIFVLEQDQVDKRTSHTLENESNTREINKRLKAKFGDRISLDLHLDFVTMEDLVMRYNIETDDELAA